MVQVLMNWKCVSVVYCLGYSFSRLLKFLIVYFDIFVSLPRILVLLWVPF